MGIPYVGTVNIAPESAGTMTGQEFTKQFGKVLSLALLVVLVYTGATHPTYDIPAAAWVVFGAIAGVDIRDTVKDIIRGGDKK